VPTSDVTGVVTSDLDARFRVTQLLPIILLAMLLGALIVAGAPTETPDFGVVTARLEDGDWSAPLIAIAGSILLALILRPFQIATCPLA
jgi:hypothetical protein